MTTPSAPATTTEQRLPAPPAGTVRALLQSEEIKARFREVLANRAPQFIASLSTLVYASAQLKTCEPYSVIASALKAAALDLPIEPSLGFASIVPYKGRAIFQIQWKGYVQLALRTNQYAGINVTEALEGMVRRVNRFTGEIIKGEPISDKIVGYYAWFKLLNGFEHEDHMTVEQVLAHGKRYSKTFDNPKSAWQTDLDAMGRKTIIKRLLTRYGILSVEMRQAITAEVIPDEDPQPEGIDGDATDSTPAEQREADKTALFGEDEPSERKSSQPSQMSGAAKSNGAKSAVIKTQNWFAAAGEFAETHPRYQTPEGKPDMHHLLDVVAQSGYHEINDANLQEIVSLLNDRERSPDPIPEVPF